MNTNVEEKETYYTECRTCKTEFEIKAYEKDMNDWNKGKKHIQNAMPYLNANTRELLISGICGTCFDKLYGSDDE
jgi:hypothetical protein